MFPVKLKQDHFTFSAGCIMSDHVLAPSIFPCSQRKEKKKKGIFPNSLFHLGVPFQSCWTWGLRHKAEIRQQGVQKNIEIMKKPCHVAGDPIASVRALKKGLRTLPSFVTAFAAMKHEPWAVLRSTSRRQNTTDPCIKLDAGSKAHWIPLAAVGLTALVPVSSHNFCRHFFLSFLSWTMVLCPDLIISRQ